MAFRGKPQSWPRGEVLAAIIASGLLLLALVLWLADPAPRYNGKSRIDWPPPPSVKPPPARP